MGARYVGEKIRRDTRRPQSGHVATSRTVRVHLVPSDYVRATPRALRSGHLGAEALERSSESPLGFNPNKYENGAPRSTRMGGVGARSARAGWGGARDRTEHGEVKLT